MTKKVKPLSEHDINEVLMFRQFLLDKEVMQPAELYTKYQEYCGLSDAELARIVGAPPKEGD